MTAQPSRPLLSLTLPLVLASLLLALPACSEGGDSSEGAIADADQGAASGVDGTSAGAADAESEAHPDAVGSEDAGLEGGDAEGPRPEAPADPLIVSLSDGQWRGEDLGDVRVWRGLPFAAPPVGELRWQPPAPAESFEGIRDALEYGAACEQGDTLELLLPAGIDEDCLSLNVWRPVGEDAPEGPLPVMVWIHGGAFTLGSGGESSYVGANLARRGVVVVTINYRLGPLGFLAHDALLSEASPSPNYGFLDQQAALRWVHEEIGHFGGDKDNVTLFGESAGSMSTCLHLVAPDSAGLLHRAIMESGACAGGRTELEDAKADGQTFVEAVGCGQAEDVAACLREAPAQELVAAQGTSALFFGDGPGWGPIGDGLVVPEDPGAVIAAGDHSSVPSIVGSNADEGTLFVSLGGLDLSEPGAYEEALIGYLGDAVAAEAMTIYPLEDYESPEAAFADMMGHSLFVCPTRTLARLLADAGTPTWRYDFRYPFVTAYLGDLGAMHTAELPFVFDNPFLFTPRTEEERPLVEAVMGYWTRLARSGDPNDEGAATWPAYVATSDPVLVLDLELETEDAPHATVCDFWDGIALQ